MKLWKKEGRIFEKWNYERVHWNWNLKEKIWNCDCKIRIKKESLKIIISKENWIKIRIWGKNWNRRQCLEIVIMKEHIGIGIWRKVYEIIYNWKIGMKEIWKLWKSTFELVFEGKIYEIVIRKWGIFGNYNCDWKIRNERGIFEN